MTDDRAQDTERLRRHLRALSAVNRQLQAQLESGIVPATGSSSTPTTNDLLATADADGRQAALKIRRASSGSAWLEQLRLEGGAGTPFLVRAPNGHSFLIEGTLRRRIKAGLLTAALRHALGPARDVSDAELDTWREGPPVEVLEGGTGPAFIIVGGRRLPLRGLPLPHPVSTDEMLQFPTGEELHLAATGRSAGASLSQVREVVARDGVIRGSSVVVRKAARRLRTVFTRSG